MKSQKNEIPSDFKGGIFIMKQIDWEKIRQEEFPILNTDIPGCGLCELCSPAGCEGCQGFR